MSLRQKRIAEDFAILKKMFKAGTIKQLKPYPDGRKSIEHLAVLLEGPAGTPYARGLYRLEIKYRADYPYSPPFVRLHTPIWHPNFWPNPNEYKGKRNICLGLVDPDLKGTKAGWSPSKNISSIINAIIAMFNVDATYTNPNDVFNRDAAVEMLQDRKKFLKKAEKISKKYAKKEW